MKNGMPWELAMGGTYFPPDMLKVVRRAAGIIFQEFEGRKFDIDAFKWIKT